MNQEVRDYAITPLSSQTGAEVRGIDLRRPIERAIREHLNRTFVDHSVLAQLESRLFM
jgi:alpha-ketoglutarate-dependent taurine dioxygenase